MKKKKYFMCKTPHHQLLPKGTSKYAFIPPETAEAAVFGCFQLCDHLVQDN
jgi:hypothetical protein